MRKVTERFDGERMAWTYEWKVFYEVVMVSHDLWLFLQATEVIRIEKKKKDKGMLYRVWLDKNDIHIFQLGKVRLRSTFAYFEHAQKF